MRFSLIDAEMLAAEIPLLVPSISYFVTQSLYLTSLETAKQTCRSCKGALLRMDLNTIRVFAITKLAWIKSQQKKLREQERETPREYLDWESHYVWRKRYLLLAQAGREGCRTECRVKAQQDDSPAAPGCQPREETGAT